MDRGDRFGVGHRADAALRYQEPEVQRGVAELDFVGLFLVVLALGCLEVVLDRGQTDDWLSSNFILTFTILSGLGFVLLIPWELTRKDPLIDLKLLTSRQFSLSFLFMLLTAAILFGTTQFIPQLLQTEFGYTATLAGLTLSPGGFTTMAMLPFVNIGMKIMSPKWLIAFGLAGTGVAAFSLTHINSDITFAFATWSRIEQAVFLPFVFITVTTAAYAGLPPDKINMASGLINVARNLGGSIGVALAQTMLARREQFHQSRLVEHVVPTNHAYQDTLARTTHYFMGQGQSAYEASRQAIGVIGQAVTQQAAFLAYIDVFYIAAIAAILCAPLALLLKK